MASTTSSASSSIAATNANVEVVTLDPIALPIVSIQPDFQTVIADVRDGTSAQEDVWVSCYRVGANSVHGKVRIELALDADAGGRRGVELRGRDGVVLEQARGGHFIAACAPLEISSTLLRVPRRVLQPPEDSSKTKEITTLAVAPDLIQIAIGYADGTIYRLPLAGTAANGAAINGHAAEATDSAPTPIPLIYSPHLSSTGIATLRYFPSSRVLLSGGQDFALHILDAELSPSGVSEATTGLSTLSRGPPPVRTLRGHTRAITSTALISRGRNILSTAKDATVRLWDVASSTQIRMAAAESHTPIYALALGEAPQEWAANQAQGPSPPFDPREVDTANKLAFVALQDGRFEAFDVGARFARVYLSPKTIYSPSSHWGRSPTSAEFPSSRALTAIAYAPESHLLATGSARGVVAVYDVRALRSRRRGEGGVEPLCVCARNEAEIESLAFVPRSSSLLAAASVGTTDIADDARTAEAYLAVATSDGLPYVASVRPHTAGVYAELTAGADCEAVRAVEVDSSGAVWTASDDGILRMY